MSNYGRAAFNNRQPYNNLQNNGGQPLLEKSLTSGEVDVQKHWLTDTVRFLKGVVVKPQTIKLFKIGIGQQAAYANVPGVKYTKTEGDTTMQQGNFLSGQEFDIANVQACISRRYISLDAAEEALRAAAAATNASGVIQLAGQIEIVEHLAETATLTNKYGGSNKERESGLLKFFPTGYGQAVSTGGTSYVKSNNGFGVALPLLVTRKLGDKTNIDVEIEILEAFNPTVDFQIQVIHDGKLIRPIA
jgi:hypothetical protein